MDEVKTAGEDGSSWRVEIQTLSVVGNLCVCKVGDRSRWSCRGGDHEDWAWTGHFGPFSKTNGWRKLLLGDKSERQVDVILPGELKGKSVKMEKFVWVSFACQC